VITQRQTSQQWGIPISGTFTSETGDVPENVNFAIKSHVVLGFIDRINGVTDDLRKDASVFNPPSLAEEVHEFAFLIEFSND
jgi:hypothetical protein